MREYTCHLIADSEDSQLAPGDGNRKLRIFLSDRPVRGFISMKWQKMRYRCQMATRESG